MIHTLIDVKAKQISQFTTNISTLGRSIPVKWMDHENEESNIIWDIEKDLTMAEFWELIGKSDWDGSEIAWMGKTLFWAGKRLVLTRRGEVICEYEIQDGDRIIEVDPTRYPEIEAAPDEAIIHLTGFVKSHDRFRLYYQGRK